MSLASAIQSPFIPTAPVDAASRVDTLIVSDLHLGLPAARPRAVHEMLEEWRFERLILLGDVFHDWRFRHLCADTWRLLANTGCWVDRPASFVTVGAMGVALNHCP
jgi:metallophosphoesterase superfamily enzyme